jgi:glycosyltransferase involved in cell wall biosynthesis
MTTLVVTAFTPTLDSGTGVRTHGVVAALARLGPVELAYYPFGAQRPAREYAALDGVTLRRLGRRRGARRGLAYATARARAVPHDLARGAAPELADAAGRAPAGVRVVADGPTVAAALLGIAARRPVAYCAHNLESAFRPGVPGERASRAALERFERRVLAAMDETWMVSRADLEGARALWPAARLRLVPNVVDVAAIEPVTPAVGSQRIVFVGDLTYEPNRDAVAFLCDEVMPRVWSARPRARLTVAGRGGRPRGDDRVEVLGFVADLRAVYASAAAVAVPLLHGGGSPLKFVEALAYGLPVVATPTAARGLDAVPGRHFVEAGSAASFAAALVRVLDGGASTMAAQGRSLVRRRYSVEALARELRR